MKKLGTSLILVSSVILANSANSAVIVQSDVDTTDFTIQANNDYAPMVGQTGQIGATIVATDDTPLLLTFEYLFKEASYNNGFFYTGNQEFSTNTAVAGDSFSTVWEGGAGALDFFFKPGSLAPVTNAGNDSNAPANFWTQLDEATGSILIGLDDSGNRNDDDYDDMVIRLTATNVAPEPNPEVPEPATLGLLGLGVVAVGLSRRKNKTQ